MFKVLIALSAVVLAGSSAFASGRIVASPGQCSRGGDETSRPVLKVVKGKLVLVGWECVQDNGSNNGG